MQGVEESVHCMAQALNADAAPLPQAPGGSQRAG